MKPEGPSHHNRDIAAPGLAAVRLGVVGFVVAISLVGLASHWIGIYPFDMADYWDAATRLRDGQPLYQAGPGDRVSEFRYAPWFACAWIPLTYLDRDVVTTAWIVLLAACTAAVVFDVGRRGLAGVAVAILLGAQLLWWVRGGNVQPLMVALLYFGIRTRAGPLAVAIAATLKVVPLAFVLVYAARRQWGRVALTAGLAVLLAAPILAHDLSNFGQGVDTAATNLSLFRVSPVLWAVGGMAVLFVTGAGVLMRWRSVPFWTALTAVVALPRLFIADMTLMLVAIGASDDAAAGDSAKPRPLSRSTES